MALRGIRTVNSSTRAFLLKVLFHKFVKNVLSTVVGTSQNNGIQKLFIKFMNLTRRPKFLTTTLNAFIS
jgi:hypothetical protein